MFFLNQVQPVLNQYCAKCHGPDKKEGQFSIHTFAAEVGAERDGYARILERLQAGDMLPDGEPGPDALSVKRIVARIKDGLATEATVAFKSEIPIKPNDGNRVPHGLLFNAKAPDAIPPPPRLWRMRPSTCREGFVRAVRANENNKLLSQPFDLIADPGIKDYAQLYAIDSAGTEVLLRNAQLLVEEGDGTMLDNTLIIYLSDSGEAHHPNLLEWPVILLGNLGGRLKAGNCLLKYPRYAAKGHKTMASLYLSFLHVVGKPREHFGQVDPKLADIDTKGSLSELLL